MFELSEISSNKSQGASSWFWASEPQTSMAHDRTWTVLETALWYIPIVGWLILFVLSLLDSEPKKLEVEMKEIQPTKDELFVKEKTEELSIYQAQLNKMVKEKWNISATFLEKISYTIGETEVWLESTVVREIRNNSEIKDLNNELLNIKKLQESLKIKKTPKQQVIEDLKRNKRVENEGLIIPNSSAADANFFKNLVPPMGFF